MKFLTDENFNRVILNGLLRHNPTLDIVRVQDVGLMQTPDQLILEWAAGQERILLTHDAATIPDILAERIQEGKGTPGVFLVQQIASIGVAIEELSIAIECSIEGEWQDQILFIPI